MERIIMVFGRKHRIRFFAFLEIYIERYLKIKDMKSWVREMGRVNRIRDHFGNILIHKIETSDIEEFLADLLRQGFKPATVNRYHARLSSMMRRAYVWGYRNDNPVDRIESMKEMRMGDRYLEPEEFQELLNACDPQLRCLVMVAAQTGMRRGELMALRWEDVQWEGGYLIVRADNSKTSEGRIVPMNDHVIQALVSLEPGKNGKVFPFGDFPTYRWKKVRIKIGWDRIDNPRIKGWRFHDLRHCTASWMAMADVPLSKVAKILGHKQLTTTQRYAHLSDRSLFDAVQKIGAVLNDKEK